MVNIMTGTMVLDGLTPIGDVETGAVIYTDGSCRPMTIVEPGNVRKFNIGGWGVHGYFYNAETPKKGHGCKKGVPTDHGYEDNKELAVTVLTYMDGHGLVGFEDGKMSDHVTNNMAEMMAAYNGIAKVLTMIDQYPIKRITVRSDSRQVIDGMRSWAYKWRDNGWIKQDGEPVKNQPLWELMLAQVEAVTALGIVISWEWVKGHNGELGNEKSDYLSNLSFLLFKKGDHQDDWQVIPTESYWKTENDYNRLLTLKRWYFIGGNGPLTSKCGRRVYHTGDLGKGNDDEERGKKFSDAAFSVAYLKEPEPVMELVREYQDTLINRTNASVFQCNLDQLLVGRVYSTLKEKGTRLLYRSNGRTFDLNFPEKLSITVECDPPRLVYRAISELTNLQERLDEYLSPGHGKLAVTDITDVLYETIEGKKTVTKLRKEFDSALKSFNVAVSYDTRIDANRSEGELPKTNLTLSFDLDLARRNALNAIADQKPKVSVITWRYSDSTFRYATVVETEHDVGIWAAVYANLCRVYEPAK